MALGPNGTAANRSYEETVSSTRALRRGRRDLAAPFVNLTPMVDVLSVLMFFLLSIYSGGGFLTVLPPGLNLPNSTTRTPLPRQIEVAVLPDRILVDRQVVADDPRAFAENEALLLPSLREALAVYQAEGSPEARITVEADRRIPFRLLKKVLYTADQAGFHRQSLAVRQVGG